MKTLKEARQLFDQRWRAMAARERRLVSVGAVLLGLALLWWVGLQPALRTLKETPPRIAALDEQLRQMRGMAAEARQLQGAPAVSQGQSAQALQLATERLGQNVQLSLLGDRASVTLQSVRGEALWAWLNEARSAARARPVEARLTLGPQGYSGSVVFQLPAGGAP